MKQLAQGTHLMNLISQTKLAAQALVLAALAFAHTPHAFAQAPSGQYLLTGEAASDGFFFKVALEGAGAQQIEANNGPFGQFSNSVGAVQWDYAAGIIGFADGSFFKDIVIDDGKAKGGKVSGILFDRSDYTPIGQFLAPVEGIPTGLVLDSQQNVYFSAISTNSNFFANATSTIYKSDANGQFSPFATISYAGGLPMYATGLAIDRNDNLFVSAYSGYIPGDYGDDYALGFANHIFKITPSGTVSSFLTQDLVGQRGNLLPDMFLSIAVDKSDNIFLGRFGWEYSSSSCGTLTSGIDLIKPSGEVSPLIGSDGAILPTSVFIDRDGSLLYADNGEGVLYSDDNYVYKVENPAAGNPVITEVQELSTSRLITTLSTIDFDGPPTPSPTPTPAPTVDTAYWSGTIDKNWNTVGNGGGTNWAADQAGTPANAVPGGNATVYFSADEAQNQFDTQLDQSLTLKTVIVNTGGGITVAGNNAALTVREGFVVNNGTLTLNGTVNVAREGTGDIVGVNVTDATKGSFQANSGLNLTVTANDGTGSAATGVYFNGTPSYFTNCGTIIVTAGNGTGSGGGVARGVQAGSIQSVYQQGNLTVTGGSDLSGGNGGAAVGVLSYGDIGSVSLNYQDPNTIQVTGGTGATGGYAGGIQSDAGGINSAGLSGNIFVKGGEGLSGLGGDARVLSAYTEVKSIYSSFQSPVSWSATGGNGTAGGGTATIVQAGSVSGGSLGGNITAIGGTGSSTGNGGSAIIVNAGGTISSLNTGSSNSATMVVQGGNGLNGGSAYGFTSYDGNSKISNFSLYGTLSLKGGDSLGGGSGGEARAVNSWHGALENLYIYAKNTSVEGGAGGGNGGGSAFGFIGVSALSYISITSGTSITVTGGSDLSGTATSRGGNAVIAGTTWYDGGLSSAYAYGNLTATGGEGSGGGGGEAAIFSAGGKMDGIYNTDTGIAIARGGDDLQGGNGGAAYGLNAWYSGGVKDFYNSGVLEVTGGNGKNGGYATGVGGSSISGGGLFGSGGITVTGGNSVSTGNGGNAYGFNAGTISEGGNLYNTAKFQVIGGTGNGTGSTGGWAYGFVASGNMGSVNTYNPQSRIAVTGGNGTSGANGGWAIGVQASASAGGGFSDTGILATGGSSDSGNGGNAYGINVGNTVDQLGVYSSTAAIQAVGGNSTSGAGGYAYAINAGSIKNLTSSGSIIATGGFSETGNGGSSSALNVSGTIENLGNYTGKIQAFGGNSTDGSGGNANAIWAGAITSLSNSGSITAQGGSGAGSWSSGQAYGIFIWGGTTTSFNNYGSITASGGNGASYAGFATALYSGAQTDVFYNSANILATGGNGTTSGGSGRGIYLNSVTDFVNAGTVTGLGGSGTDSSGGYGSGFEFSSAGNISNSGTITGTGGRGTLYGGYGWGAYGGSLSTFTNTGNIIATGGSSYGEGGKGGEAYGFYTWSESGTIDNAKGVISATGGSGTGGGGGDAYAFFDSSESGSSRVLNGIYAATGGGDEDGGAGGSAYGFFSYGTINSLTVEGSVTGTAGIGSSENATGTGIGVLGATIVELTNNGTISGSSYGIFEGAYGWDEEEEPTGLAPSTNGNDTVITNRGDLSGGIAAIVLGSGNKTLNLEGGSITGNITAGNGTNVINVKADTLVSGGITNFRTVNVFNDAKLTAGILNTLEAETNLTIGEAVENTGGIFDLGGYSQTIRTLNSAGTGDTRVVGLVPNDKNRIAPLSIAPEVATLTVTDGGSFAGVLDDGDSTLQLKVAGGVLSLSGNNTFTGGTVLANGGTLLVSSVEALGAGESPVLTFNGTGGIFKLTETAGNLTLTSARDIVLEDNAYAVFDTTSETNRLEFAGSFRTTGNLTGPAFEGFARPALIKIGNGTLALTGKEGSQIGTTFVSNGLLSLESGGALASGFTLVDTEVPWEQILPNAPEDASPKLQIDGAGSTLVTSQLGVGAFGNGELGVSNGGNLTVTEVGYVGYLPGSEGLIVVEGNGTTAAFGQQLILGGSGNGTLVIRDGAVVQSGMALLGAGEFDQRSVQSTTPVPTAGVGTATVTGTGSRWEIAGPLIVDAGGYGYLNVTNGGVVKSEMGFIGGAPGIEGKVLLSGEDSLWETKDDIYVGQFGKGVLTVADGAAVVVNEGEGDIVLGGGLGTLNVGNGTAAGYVIAKRIVGSLPIMPTLSVVDEPPVDLAPGVLNFNHSDYPLVFAPEIVGNVAVNQTGEGTTILEGDVAYMGPTTITDGELQFKGNTAGLGGNITNNASLVFDQKNNSVYAGVLSGTGYLSKYGNSTLTLAGVNTFAGSTFIGEGTLVFANDTSKLKGSIEAYEGTTLAFDQKTDSSYSGVISGAGQVVKVGAGNLVLSGASTYSGATLVQEGTVTFTGDTGGMGGPIVNGGTVVFDQAADSSFKGDIAGPGTLVKSGAGLLKFTGVVEAAEALINAGTVWVQNQLTAASVKIASGATLGGIGTINGNVINNGTIAPGNSPGTLVVNGNYVQGSGGVFNLEIASATVFDKLIVNGTASLAGTLKIIPYAGFSGLTVGQQIPFLTATGGITGGFSSIQGSFVSSNIRGKLILVGGTLVLVVGPTSYDAIATMVPLTQNQKNVAKALSGFLKTPTGDKFTVTSALDILQPEQYPEALNAISPAQYESLANTSIAQADALSQILQQRFASNRLTGGRGFTQQGLKSALVSDSKAVKDSKDILTPAPDNNWGVWVQGDGFFGNFMSLANIPNARFSSGGVTAGVDYRFPVGVTVGAFAGYQGLYSKYANGGTMNINTVNFGLYASYEAACGFYANVIVNGGSSAYSVKRPIQFSTIDRAANSDPNGGLLSTTLDLGYDWKVGGLTITPTAVGQFTYVGIAPFTETGADALDLRVNNQSAYSMTTALGARIAYTYSVNEKLALIPQVSMSWQHQYMQNARNIGASLDGGAGPSFEYATAVLGRDSVNASAGFTLKIGENVGFNANYNVNFGSQNFVSQMVSGGLNISF